MGQYFVGKVKERSAFKVTMAWKASGDTAVTPDSATWTLTNESGDTINSRSEVAITGLSTTNSVTIYGDDTAIQSSTDNGKRIFTAQAIYDSDDGLDMPMNDEYVFYIDDLVNVT